VRLVAGVLAVAGVCCASRTVRAGGTPASDQPLAQAIDVSSGATCLEEERLQAQVRTWLGHDRLRADLHVHVQGDDTDPRAVVFRIVLGGKPRERRFDGLPAGCEDATAVVGLAVALAIDANVVSTIVAPVVERPALPARKVLALQVSAGLEVVPGASLGLAAGFEYGLGSWISARLDLMAQVSRSNAIEGAAGVFDVVAGGPAPQLCAGGAVTGSFRFELCSGVVAGLLHAQGRGYTVSHAATGPWIMASGGARLLFTAGIPWAIDVDGVFPIYAPAFRAEVSPGSSLYRNPSAAGALLSVGPAFTF
jgi:hypothetical protein